MDFSLFKKYNIPGPRYTSYPTVPYWDTNPTSEQWISDLKLAIEDATAQNMGAAIYVHVPFCESLCTYCGCNTRITRNHAVANPYIDVLLKEFDLYRKKLAINGKLKLSELHLGGGTPTFLSPPELGRLLEGLLSQCELTPDHELSIEVDPRVTGNEHLAVLSRFGFNRISLGVQDFDPKVQEIVHRVQSVAQVRDITVNARTLGMSSVNYDLIYGLPFQSSDSIQNTIQKVIELKPDRIAFYSYAHVPWIKASQRRFTEADLPTGDEKRALYELGRNLLEEAGYFEIGMDHFALKTDSLYAAVQKNELHRNFMGYTARNVSPILALGVSAIGDSWNSFAQNEKLLETYQERVNKGEIPIQRGHLLNDEDLVLRRHILNLMTHLETAWSLKDDGTEYLAVVPSRLTELQKDGLVEVKTEDDEVHCQVTEKGRPFLRNICMAFDARLVRKAPETKLFSQTV
ncbi:MAG: oxygen-independent coproporphyrinogen III oxidase [Bdellovibrionales bacterium]|nr:oxygen-independent coproporphyrinogen III oxidase [Bdellovibrionales bacterium]